MNFRVNLAIEDKNKIGREKILIKGNFPLVITWEVYLRCFIRIKPGRNYIAKKPIDSISKNMKTVPLLGASLGMSGVAKINAVIR